tara:strand:- start:519 stop:809 length:291 start_codon:yes stop_codon:yes gene_type:complete
MISVDGVPELGTVDVKTTHNEGLSPEYWAERIVEKIVSVSNKADPMVQAQANAFKDVIHQTILLYLKQAIASDRATVAGLLDKQGHKEMAKIIRRL